MHVKHLGTDMYYLGSCLHLLCYSLIPCDPTDALAIVLRQCKDYWGRHNVSPADTYGKLKLSMFIDIKSPANSYPKLKGKAAEVKHLVPALATVWEHWMEPDDPIHQQILLGLRKSAEIDSILHRNASANSLPAADRDAFASSIWIFLACQTSAARYFSDRGELEFDITVKSHCLAHCAMEAEYINPRKGWCYSGESFMNKCKTLGASAVRGNSAPKACSKMIGKYRHGIHFRMSP